LGGFSFQPAEFAKMATALMLATHLNSFQTNLNRVNSQLFAFGIILLPALLIVIQPDPGSALAFGGLIFMLFRENLNLNYLYILLSSGVIFILSLLYQFEATSLFLTFVILLIYFLIKRIRPKLKIFPFVGILILSVGFSYSVDYIFNEVFEQRHRDRFNIVLGKTVDTQGIGYNINQSKIAIGSGGIKGKGFLQGTQTKGNFVPEQHTDYIFSTVGEEWGFVGCSFIVLAYTILIIRILFRAEKQNNSFRRSYAYGVAGILFVHFFVNIGMSLGLVPTVGIPLPFISYGGSNLLFFSLLFFVHLNFDANRLSIW
ncbi:MAG: rod shape-determining protein RodA, partial [Flavobacteriaceae bacterium]